MGSKILGVFSIEYNNGVKQIKDLISHYDYVEVYKKTQDRIYELEKENKFKETNTTRNLKKELKEMFGTDFFTDESPLYYAIKTDTLSMPIIQGGNMKCKVVKIK